MDMDRRFWMRLHLVDPEADEFGHSQAGSEAEVEHGAISGSKAGLRIRRVEQGLQLLTVEVIYEGLVGLLEGNRHNASYLFDGRWNPILDEMHECLQGGQAGISRPR